MRLRHHAHAVVDSADVFEERCHFPHNPLRHAVDAHGQTDRHRNRADGHRAVQPEPDAEGGNEELDDRIVDVDADVEERNLPHLPVHGAEEGIHSLPRIDLFAARVGEQLHRRDIGVAVDDPARHQRAGIRLFARRLAQLRDEVAQDQRIDEQPQHQRNAEPPVDGGDQRQHRDEEGHGIDEDVDDLHHAFADGQRRLHHLGRDATGKLVGEEGHRVPEQEAVHLPARNHREIAGQHLMHGDRMHHAEHRQTDQQQACHPGERAALRLQEGRAIGGRQPVHDIAEELIEKDFGDRDQTRAEAEQHQPPARRFRVMPAEGDQAFRRQGRLTGRIGIQAAFEPREHG